MYLSTVELLNFRNYQSVSLELPEKGALFIGRNGSGKTNFLESLSFLITGKSVRSASVKQLLNKDESEGYVCGTFIRDESSVTQSVGFSRKGEVQVSVNGVEFDTLSVLYGNRGFLYFGPEDITLITGGPIERRRFIDFIISQVDKNYLSCLIAFKKSLAERNRVLTGYYDDILLDIYEEEMSRYAHYIIAARLHYLSVVKDSFSAIYSSISGNDLFMSFTYNSSLSEKSVEEIQKFYKMKRSRDRELKYTSSGPHRDDLKFKADGNSLVGFGSQGQCRSTALAFKIATVSYLKEVLQSAPIIAVDDAFSDLDVERKGAFFEKLDREGQLFIALHTESEASCYDLPSFFVSEGSING